MSSLSDEEIIKYIKEMIQFSDYNIYKMALQGLLDLYNKEVQTSHFLQNQLDIANAKIYELLEKLENK